MAAVHARGSATASETKGLRERPVIAVIDDDESVLTALTSLLRSTGFSVATFAGAHEFLRSPRMADSASLIVDMCMPGMTGPDLQRHLVASGHRRPIILITAYAEPATRTQALTAGALCLLTKPFAAEELLGWIATALGQDIEQKP